jgi:membrane protein required for colicin V production
MLDPAVVAILAAVAIGGAMSGALRQVAQLLAVAAGWLAARHLGPPVAEGFARVVPALVARPAASAVLFLGGWAAAGLLANLVLRARGLSGLVHGAADRGLGAILGGAKGALVVWVLLSAAALAGPFSLGPLRFDARASDFAGFARAHNLLARFDREKASTLERLLRIARDPAAAAGLRDPDAKRLLADPRVRRLAERTPDGLPPGGPATGETERLLADPEIAELLARMRARSAPPAEAP